MNPKAICRLCGVTAELQTSHIIPTFVFKWLKESSGTGHFRFAQEPNKRVQDGLKAEMLCRLCEEKFNGWETEFSKRVFHPLTNGTTDTVRYGEWMSKFCVSVSWRVLTWFRQHDDLDHIPKKLNPRVMQNGELMRQWLMGERVSISEIEQHFLPLGVIETPTTRQLPRNINRYILRSVGMSVITNQKFVLIYSKIGPFIILGFLINPKPKQWVGSKINFQSGIVTPRKYILPKDFGNFIFGEARKIAKANASLSDRQKTKIGLAFEANRNRFIDSETFRAMNADVRLFGAEAFEQK